MGNITKKYDSRKWCNYPYIPNDVFGYCWGFARIKDSSFKTKLEDYCKTCEYFNPTTIATSDILKIKE